MRRVGVGVIASAIASLALVGCSQVASLTPVSGASITTVRNAANDVLVDQQIPILVAPKCTAVTDGFSCTGSTVNGEEILVTAGPTTPFDMSISVGGAIIFEGNAVDVLQSAVQEAS